MPPRTGSQGWPAEAELSPDGHRLVVANVAGDTTAVWDTSTWQLATPLLMGAAAFSDIAFSRDGTKAATLAGDPEVLQLRDPTTFATIGDPVLAATTANGAGTRVQFSDDGQFLVTTGAAGMPVWDAAMLTPMGRPFPAESDNFWGGEYATTAQLVSGDLDADAVVWDADPAHWPALACRVVGRNLTRDEWDQFGPDTRSYESTCDEWPGEPPA